MISAFVFRCNECQEKAVQRTAELPSPDLNSASKALTKQGWLIRGAVGAEHYCPACAASKRTAEKEQVARDRELRDGFLGKVHDHTRPKKRLTRRRKSV